MKTTRHDRTDTIRIDRKSLGDGSERRDAYLTRTGIFVYHFDPEDGLGFREVRELRPPEEVFAADSLETLKNVALVLGHPATIDSDNWKSYFVGNVGDDIRKSEDGKYVAGSLVIRDKEVRDRVDRGELGEVSCGYQVELDWTPGEYEGERYDAVQRNIRYNHVGIGDANGWGRAGHEVRIRDAYADDMLKKDNATATRIDAPAGAPGATPNTNVDADNQRLRQDLDAARGERDAVRAERDSAREDAKREKERADKAEGERDALQAKLDAAQKDVGNIDARVQARIELQDAARPVLGADFVFTGKSDREIRVAVLTKHDPKFDAKDKSDAYLEGAFRYAANSVKADKDALASVNEVVNADASAASTAADSVIEDERAKMQKRNADAWKPKAPATKSPAAKA